METIRESDDPERDRRAALAVLHLINGWPESAVLRLADQIVGGTLFALVDGVPNLVAEVERLRGERDAAGGKVLPVDPYYLAFGRKEQ